MSAYLPTSLDAYGMPESFDSTKESDATTNQEEAHAIYSTATEWTRHHKNWILGWDLNETIEMGQKKISEKTYSYHGTGTKFIQHFLNDSRGVDLWRMLHPPDEKDPESGHTCFHNQGRSSARLDYFLVSKDLFQDSIKTTMLLGEWYKNASDHMNHMQTKLKDVFTPPVVKKKITAINKPNISALAPNEKLLLIKTINHQLLSILKGIDETKNTTINLADELSIKTDCRFCTYSDAGEWMRKQKNPNI